MFNGLMGCGALYLELQPQSRDLTSVTAPKPSFREIYTLNRLQEEGVFNIFNRRGLLLKQYFQLRDSTCTTIRLVYKHSLKAVEAGQLLKEMRLETFSYLRTLSSAQTLKSVHRYIIICKDDHYNVVQ